MWIMLIGLFGGTKQMRIVLVCPSNMLYMPYVNNYERILQACAVEYEIINWDRFHIEDKDYLLKYRDSKIGHQRNVLDYYRFSTFIKEKLESNKYNKVIVFGIQIAFFLKSILRNKYNGKYVLDIRDHNRIIKFFNIKRVIENSGFTVLSSPSYKEWLPQSNKYLINHNTPIDNLQALKEVDINTEKLKVTIAYIGAIRDYAINIDLINSVQNNEKIGLYFHGEGDINKDIISYLKANHIKNVFLTGRYERKNENGLYKEADLINVLRYNDGINNKTALPNRLYNSVLHGIPMLAFEGTYLAEVVKTFNLGLVLDSFSGVEKNITNYLNKFDAKEYQKGRISFFEDIIKENCCFTARLKKFIGD